MGLESILKSVKTGLTATALGLALLLPFSNANADTHYVSLSGSNTSPYTNQVTASRNVQDAINEAGNGDIVEIANGTYNGTGNRDLTWNANIKHLTVTSENGNQINESCVIDAQGNGHGFILDDQGHNSKDIIQGIRIRNGASQWEYTAEANKYWGGGGIFIRKGSPTIRNVVIEDCVAIKSPRHPSYADGGGMDIVEGSPLIQDCIIRNNEATHTGGGIHCYLSDPIIERCLIEGNHNDGCYGGGGLSFIANSRGIVRNNLIKDNTAHYYTIGGFGAGIECMNSIPNIINNTIANNSTKYSSSLKGEGGGIRIRGLGPGGKTPYIANNIIYDNISSNKVGDFDFDDQGNNWSITLDNNAIGDGNTNKCNVVHHSSNLWDINPQFESSSDYHLQETSPCRDAGKSIVSIVDDLEGTARDSNIDIGCYEYADSTPNYTCTVDDGGYGVAVPGTTNDVPHGTILRQARPAYLDLGNGKRARANGYTLDGVDAVENP